MPTLSTEHDRDLRARHHDGKRNTYISPQVELNADGESRVCRRFPILNCPPLQRVDIALFVGAQCIENPNYAQRVNGGDSEWEKSEWEKFLAMQTQLSSASGGYAQTEDEHPYDTTMKAFLDLKGCPVEIYKPRRSPHKATTPWERSDHFQPTGAVATWSNPTPRSNGPIRIGITGDDSNDHRFFVFLPPAPMRHRTAPAGRKNVVLEATREFPEEIASCVDVAKDQESMYSALFVAFENVGTETVERARSLRRVGQHSPEVRAVRESCLQNVSDNDLFFDDGNGARHVHPDVFHHLVDLRDGQSIEMAGKACILRDKLVNNTLEGGMNQRFMLTCFARMHDVAIHVYKKPSSSGTRKWTREVVYAPANPNKRRVLRLGVMDDHYVALLHVPRPQLRPSPSENDAVRTLLVMSEGPGAGPDTGHGSVHGSGPDSGHGCVPTTIRAVVPVADTQVAFTLVDMNRAAPDIAAPIGRAPSAASTRAPLRAPLGGDAEATQTSLEARSVPSESVARDAQTPRAPEQNETPTGAPRRSTRARTPSVRMQDFLTEPSVGDDSDDGDDGNRDGGSDGDSEPEPTDDGSDGDSEPDADDGGGHRRGERRPPDVDPIVSVTNERSVLPSIKTTLNAALNRSGLGDNERQKISEYFEQLIFERSHAGYWCGYLCTFVVSNRQFNTSILDDNTRFSRFVYTCYRVFVDTTGPNPVHQAQIRTEDPEIWGLVDRLSGELERQGALPPNRLPFFPASEYPGRCRIHQSASDTYKTNFENHLWMNYERRLHVLLQTDTYRLHSKKHRLVVLDAIMGDGEHRGDDAIRHGGDDDGNEDNDVDDDRHEDNDDDRNFDVRSNPELVELIRRERARFRVPVEARNWNGHLRGLNQDDKITETVLKVRVVIAPSGTPSTLASPPLPPLASSHTSRGSEAVHANSTNSLSKPNSFSTEKSQGRVRVLSGRPQGGDGLQSHPGNEPAAAASSYLDACSAELGEEVPH